MYDSKIAKISLKKPINLTILQEHARKGSFPSSIEIEENLASGALLKVKFREFSAFCLIFSTHLYIICTKKGSFTLKKAEIILSSLLSLGFPLIPEESMEIISLDH